MATRVLYRRASQDGRDRAIQVEAARHRIPVNTYMAALHHAICTGVFPKINPKDGTLDTTSGHEVTTDQRIDMSRLMLELAMPKLKRLEPAPPDDPAAEAKAVLNNPTVSPLDAQDTLRRMTTEEIRIALAEQTAKTTPAP